MFKCSHKSIVRGVINDCDNVKVDRPDRLLSAVDSTGDHHNRRPAVFGAFVYRAVIDHRLTETQAA
jgi:hypothetical protein